MYCRGYYIGDTFKYISEDTTHYMGRTKLGFKIKIPRNRAEIDYQNEINKLNESIDIREGVKKLLDEDE